MLPSICEVEVNPKYFILSDSHYLIEEANSKLKSGYVRLKLENDKEVIPIWIEAPEDSYHSILNSNLFNPDNPKFWFVLQQFICSYSYYFSSSF